MWVRGLKHLFSEGIPLFSGVAPRVGAWIETEFPEGYREIEDCVAPRVGAWIETISARKIGAKNRRVAPRVGAWIETYQRESMPGYLHSRTPCGCVD